MSKNDVISCSEMIMTTFTSIEKATLEKNNKFFNSWKTIITKISGCGQNLYEHSKIVDTKNGILLIETDHPGWSQMMQINKKFILRGLEMYVPEMKIKSLAFRIKGSNAMLCGASDGEYEKQLAKENQRLSKKIEEEETVLKKYEKSDDNQSNEKSNEIPQELLNKFKSMEQTMLTKNRNK